MDLRVVNHATAKAKQLGLAADAEFVVPVNHFLTLSNPALVSACSKKSFSRVS